MITVPAGVRIYLACGATDMRRGFDGLSMQAQEVLKQDPFSGAIFCFRGRRGHLVKLLYWDGQGFCLFAKRLEKGRFTWPNTKEGAVTLSPAQMSMLLEGLEWRAPQRTLATDTGGIICALRRHDSAASSREAGNPESCGSRPTSCPTTLPS